MGCFEVECVSGLQSECLRRLYDLRPFYAQRTFEQHGFKVDNKHPPMGAVKSTSQFVAPSLVSTLSQCWSQVIRGWKQMRTAYENPARVCISLYNVIGKL